METNDFKAMEPYELDEVWDAHAGPGAHNASVRASIDAERTRRLQQGRVDEGAARHAKRQQDKADAEALKKARAAAKESALSLAAIAEDEANQFEEIIGGRLKATYGSAASNLTAALAQLSAVGITSVAPDHVTWALELSLNNDVLGAGLPLRKLGYDRSRETLAQTVARLCGSIRESIARDEHRRANPPPPPVDDEDEIDEEEAA
jgi:hypothetical protein